MLLVFLSCVITDICVIPSITFPVELFSAEIQTFQGIIARISLGECYHKLLNLLDSHFNISSAYGVIRSRNIRDNTLYAVGSRVMPQ